MTLIGEKTLSFRFLRTFICQTCVIMTLWVPSWIWLGNHLCQATFEWVVISKEWVVVSSLTCLMGRLIEIDLLIAQSIWVIDFSSVRVKYCLSVCLSLCLFVCLSICLSVRLPVRLSVRPFVCLPVYLSARLSVRYLFVRLFVCPSVRVTHWLDDPLTNDWVTDWLYDWLNNWVSDWVIN